jgi:hypothetical protein
VNANSMDIIILPIRYLLYFYITGTVIHFNKFDLSPSVLDVSATNLIGAIYDAYLRSFKIKFQISITHIHYNILR